MYCRGLCTYQYGAWSCDLGVYWPNPELFQTTFLEFPYFKGKCTCQYTARLQDRRVYSLGIVFLTPFIPVTILFSSIWLLGLLSGCLLSAQPVWWIYQTLPWTCERLWCISRMTATLSLNQFACKLFVFSSAGCCYLVLTDQQGPRLPTHFDTLLENRSDSQRPGECMYDILEWLAKVFWAVEGLA